MRRLAYLFAGAAVWLLVAAVPAFADGGPHVQSNFNGEGGLAADCAACHRIHAGRGANSLLISEESATCTTCHGSAGTGAATNVADGVQYTLASRAGNVVLGALRSGGFTNARIGSTTPTRVTFEDPERSFEPAFLAKVPVGSPAPVTSRHLSLTASAPGVAWGNGPLGQANAGVSVTLQCTTCHNPHGNEQYRILRPLPVPRLPNGSPAPGFVSGAAAPPSSPAPSATPWEAPVADAPLPSPGDARNYTVIQTKGGTGTLYASQVAGVVNSGSTELAGDYWHKRVPWNGDAAGLYDYDAPNGVGGSGSTIGSFSYQMNAWCSTCHTRYYSTSRNDTIDAIYKNRHTTRSSRTCNVCHVAHGSNAQMYADPNTGSTGSVDMLNPDGSTPKMAGDSRLLKVDNRGTCQLCHDPTDTYVLPPDPGYWVGPSPDPLNP